MNPNRGGVQRVSDTLARYFISKGYGLFYLTLEYDESDDYQFPVKLFHLPDTDFFSKVNLEYYHNLLHSLAIDLVVNHDASNNRSKLWLNTGKSSTKKISLYHTDPLNGVFKLSEFSEGYSRLIFKISPSFVRYIKNSKKKRKIGYLLKNSDKVVLLSKEFKKQIHEELGIDVSKIEAINNPCFFIKEKIIEKKKKQVLFVGRLEWRPKRPDRMLRIWSEIQDKFPDWELLILGDGPDRLKVEKMANLLELKNVSFEGYVDPIPYYKDASIICMVSDYEGFGLVLVEGMQFGMVPIAFNNWASLSDIIIDQETGIMVETDNIDQYIRKLEELMKNREYRQSISEHATEYVRKFDIEKIGLNWQNLFQSI